MTRTPAYSVTTTCLLAACLALASMSAAAGDRDEKAFNAIDGVDQELLVAVGDGGLIVHFPAGQMPRRMPSGTDRDLLDVSVVAGDFAIAVGRGIVLLWDGEKWSPVVTEKDVVPYSQAWASRDHQLFLYGNGEPGAYRLCPRLKAAAQQPFCRRFPAPLRAACGRGDSIILLFADGAIYRVNDALIGPDASYEPAFRPQSPVRLKSAWLSNETCGTLKTLPHAIGVSHNGGLVRFDGTGWLGLEAANIFLFTPTSHRMQSGAGGRPVFGDSP